MCSLCGFGTWIYEVVPFLWLLNITLSCYWKYFNNENNSMLLNMINIIKVPLQQNYVLLPFLYLLVKITLIFLSVGLESDWTNLCLGHHLCQVNWPHRIHILHFSEIMKPPLIQFQSQKLWCWHDSDGDTTSYQIW